MPFVNIVLRDGTSRDYRQAVSDAIHRAMIDVLGIPADDHFHSILEQKPENMLQDPVAFGVPRGERCMFITFYFNHREAEVKAALFQAVINRLGADVGVGPEDVLMAIVETGRENWWAAGRVVNPDTGYDERMSADALGNS